MHKKNKALILGGHGDIGRAITEKITMKLECDVTSVGRSDFDLANPDSIKNFFSKNTPSFDILVHCAGWNFPKPIELLTTDEISYSVNANLMGFIQTVQTLIPYWKHTKYGRIVVISSIYGFLARGGRLPYTVSKHGLLGAVKTLAIELAPYNTMVNAVSPGYINTKLTAQNNSQETIDRLVKGIPVGRMGTPDEVASAVCFLCSCENTYITGHNLVIDGGYTIGGFQQ